MIVTRGSRFDEKKGRQGIEIVQFLARIKFLKTDQLFAKFEKRGEQ